jgi:hypothetical protein
MHGSSEFLFPLVGVNRIYILLIAAHATGDGTVYGYIREKYIREKYRQVQGNTDNFTGNCCIIAEQKTICIYASIRYYQLDRVVQQEPVHVEREDLCIYRKDSGD